MTAISAPPVRRRRDQLVLLIVSTIVGLLVLVASIPFVMMSVMAFDAGETTEAWAVFLGAWLIPVLLILGLIVAWIAFAVRARWGVYIGLGLAALPAVAVVLLFVVLML